MSELRNALVRNAARLSDSVAFADDEGAITWRHLASRVAGAVLALGPQPETVGIAGRNGVEWAIAFLAASLAGKTIVPIPAFFSPAQIANLVADAGISRIIATDDRAASLPPSLPRERLPQTEAPLTAMPPDCTGSGRLVIFTSGSTGRPKGVRLFRNQHLFTAHALARLVGAREGDRYLSLLPLPMLLEIICAIIIPVLVGGESVFAPQVAEVAVAGRSVDLVETLANTRPNVSVMVPRLLALYAQQLLAQRKSPPESLRFLAVGGAPLPRNVAQVARRAGIPFFEGYGLSECASVVALNTPDASRPGTVGRPLPGLSVRVEDGEIVVSGPSVMDGYLHGGDVTGAWRTGDLGEMDDDGFLRVLGRKDNLIVSPTGRNISPEWIESLLVGHPEVLACAFSWTDTAGPVLLIVPSGNSEGWSGKGEAAERIRAILEPLQEVPEYALPRRVHCISPDEARRHGLFMADGTPRRQAIAAYLNERKREEETIHETS